MPFAVTHRKLRARLLTRGCRDTGASPSQPKRLRAMKPSEATGQPPAPAGAQGGQPPHTPQSANTSLPSQTTPAYAAPAAAPPKTTPTKSTLKDLPSLSLADKIRQLQECLEPTVPTSPGELPWEQDFKSPRFKDETHRTKGPAYLPFKPLSKQRRRERRQNWSFGESVGTVSEEES